MVGYSALMERAEEATYAEIGRLRQEVIEPRLDQAARAKLLNVLVHTELFEPVRNLCITPAGMTPLFHTHPTLNNAFEGKTRPGNAHESFSGISLGGAFLL